MKKSTFFDFLNRYTTSSFESFLASSTEDVDYINWHEYCLPNTYKDEVSEYRAVRKSCALFDASPIKKYKITGKDAGQFLDRVMTRKMSTQKPMRVIYATFCNEDGMLLDDGLLYKFSEDNYLLMISEIDHDEHFAKISDKFDDLKVEEISPSMSGLAFQGPKSCKILNSMGFDSIQDLVPFEIKNFTLGSDKIIIARAGFTADLGYEIWFESKSSKAIEQAITQAEASLDIRIQGYGVTALNALRLEGGFIVPGWDTAQLFEDNELERTPSELGISWTVDLDRKGDFIGKAALLKEKETGPRFKTLGLTFDLTPDQENKAKDGMKIYSIVDGKELEAGFFPTVARSEELNSWLGIASIKSEYSKKDVKYHLQIGGDQITCIPQKLPFVKFDRYSKVPAPI
jgi:aminomethyltransferase